METAEAYRMWAEIEAHGSSPSYERLALAVAEDDAALALLDSMPPEKRQPNLLFGAMRWHGAPVSDPDDALRWLPANQAQVRQTMSERRTQTNEVSRCALFLPALAQLPPPLSLIEVGASAGLCLLCDEWRYRYLRGSEELLIGPVDAPVTLTCQIEGPVPVPAAVPRIAWRAGLDLNPIDAGDGDMRRWLQCLVWPEHEQRAALLDAALDVAAVRRPNVHQGDLLTDLRGLIEQAPAGTTVVVLHSATLTYVPAQIRQGFVSLVQELGAHRLGAEGPHVLPDLLRTLPAGVDVLRDFVVSLDDQALALAHPHGRALRWVAQLP